MILQKKILCPSVFLFFCFSVILCFCDSVNTLTLVTDVVESSLISQNVGIVNAMKWFEDEPDRSYRFGVMSKNVNYNNNSHTKRRNFK